VVSSRCGRGVFVVSSWCRRGVVVVSSWCRRGVVVVLSSCGRGVVVVSSRCRRFVVVVSVVRRGFAVSSLCRSCSTGTCCSSRSVRVAGRNPAGPKQLLHSRNVQQPNILALPEYDNEVAGKVFMSSDVAVGDDMLSRSIAHSSSVVYTLSQYMYLF